MRIPLPDKLPWNEAKERFERSSGKDLGTPTPGEEPGSLILSDLPWKGCSPDVRKATVRPQLSWVVDEFLRDNHVS